MTESDVLTTHVQTFYGALQAQDYDALATVYADDYMLVRPDGSVLTKEQVLQDFRDHGLTFQSIELQGALVRIYGDASVLTGESWTVTSRGGREATAHFRLVAVYALQGGAIKLVHFQTALDAGRGAGCRHPAGLVPLGRLGGFLGQPPLADAAAAVPAGPSAAARTNRPRPAPSSGPTPGASSR